MSGGVWAAKQWLRNRTPGVIAYNDLIAIGFIRTVLKAGCRYPKTSKSLVSTTSWTHPCSNLG